ncbi:MAG: BTB/POZ domain-containing protein [Candidatus Hodarchaeales archaeon]|jgi:hypothetical protein
MASLNIEEIINKEVARRVENELELRKEEVSSAARESLEKIKEIRNENNTTELKIALQLKKIEEERAAQLLLLDRKEQYLNECSANLENRAEAIQRAVVDSSEEKMVTINMGGTVFTTLKSTLSNMSPFFANIYSDKWRDAGSSPITDKDGNIFIDRDATYFPMLLNWARDGCEPEAIKTIIKMVRSSANKNSSYVYNVCPKKYISQSFLKTLDYLGIDYIPESPDEEREEDILHMGQKIRLYWRGDRRVFEGWVIKKVIKCEGGHKVRHSLIKNGIGLNKKDVFVDILYADGDIWRYKERSLIKDQGPFSKQKSSNKNKYWHYGTEFGSKKISWKGVKANTDTVDSSSDED